MRILTLLCLVPLLSFPVDTYAGDSPLCSKDNLKITVIRGRNVSDVSGGSIGEKLALFEPTVKIQNGAMHDFKGNNVCVILMGQDTTIRDNWKAMYRREFPADLVAGKAFEWTGDSFEQGFDYTLSKSGFDYDGYIVIIRNSEGALAYAAASKAVWIKDLDKAWNLVEGKQYKRSFFAK